MSFPGARLAVVLLICAAVGGCGKREQDGPRLLLLCAAGMREPVSGAVREFEDQTGIEVDIQFAGSGTLLAMMGQLNADLYLAADGGYIEEASERGLIVSRHEIGTQSPVLAWNTSRKFEVSNLPEWVRGSRRQGMAIPETAAIGKVTEEVLKQEGVWSEIEPHAHFVTVYELANAIQLGAVDSGIIWDNVAAGYEGISIQKFAGLDEVISEVEVAVLRTSPLPGTATQLAEYLATKESGRAFFRAHGLKVEEAP